MIFSGNIEGDAGAGAALGRRRQRRRARRQLRIWEIAQRPIGDKAWFCENGVAVGLCKSSGLKTDADEAQRPDDGQHADRDQKEQRGAHVIDSMCLSTLCAYRLYVLIDSMCLSTLCAYRLYVLIDSMCLSTLCAYRLY